VNFLELLMFSDTLLFQMMDMYTRVKRERRSVKRDMYGIPIPDDKQHQNDGDESTGVDIVLMFLFLC
jgi:hypothetical protein